MKNLIIDMESLNYYEKEILAQLVISKYYNTECRICGENLPPEVMDDAVWVGYSESNDNSMLAHKKCWDSNIDKTIWKFPE